MKLGSENKKQMIILGVLAFVALLGLAYTLLDFTSGPAVPTPANPVASAPVPATTLGGTSASRGARVNASAGHEAKNVASTGGQLDPTLHMEAMLITESLVYSGNGRNIFSAISAPAAPVAVPKAIAPARPVVVAQGPPPPPPGPPPPPPIDLKFFGTVTSQDGQRLAFLLHGDDVFLASNGDIVQRRYKVIAVRGNAIEIEDMPNNNKQTLPLQAN